MEDVTPKNLHDAIYGQGPLAGAWDDKPHRLVIMAKDSLAAANAEIERLNNRLAETSMLAHKWMVRHDRVVVGLDGGDFPKPADLPDAVATLTARVAELEAGLKPFADEAVEIDDLNGGRRRFADQDIVVVPKTDLTFGHFRAARALLQKDKNHG